MANQFAEYESSTVDHLVNTSLLLNGRRTVVVSLICLQHNAEYLAERAVEGARSEMLRRQTSTLEITRRTPHVGMRVEP